MTIQEMNLIEPIQRALTAEGYTKPTEIQERAIPYLLEGRDLLGSAQTGTGKTAAFALPILQKLASSEKTQGKNRPIKALVIAPTRELASQIGESFRKYGAHLRLKTLVIYGGVSQYPQTKRLKRGVDILVATPGRLLDLVNQKHIHLGQVEHFVLDEADLMMDMGMLPDVRRIVKLLPAERQTMCFSATMPTEIAKLTNEILSQPVKVEVAPVSSTAERIEQKVYHVHHMNKTNLLIDLLSKPSVESAIVFSRTKHGADKITKSLNEFGMRAQAIHGNKTQRVRQKTLNNFKQGKIRILVATDIAARGLDISGLSHVINYNLPEVPETYVHRIGRTGRAGHEGIAISFCDNSERGHLRSIQKLIGKPIEVNDEHPYPLKEKKTEPKKRSRRRNSRKPAGQGSGQGGRKQAGKSSKNRSDRNRKSESKSRNNDNKRTANKAGKRRNRRAKQSPYGAKATVKN